MPKENLFELVGADQPRRRPGDLQVLAKYVRINWLRILRFCVLAVCGCLLMLLFLENSLIFPAPKYNPADGWNAAAYGAEDVWFTAADGTKLHGWYFDHPEPRAHVLYCHGNGDCVAYHGEFMLFCKEHRVSVFHFDYRGYGRSEGSPNEAGVIMDGYAARDWLAEKAGVPKNQITLMGRSLGGAVATDMAAKDGARGLILQNSFTSLPEVASRIYWFLPVRWLMRSQFNSAEKIVRYQGPVLISHGRADGLVPFAMGQKLFDLAPGKKTFFPIAGGNHNDEEPAEYDAAMDKFLSDL